ELGFGRVRLEFLRILQRTFSRIASSGSSIGAEEVMSRVRKRKSRPCKRKIGVKLHCSLIKAGSCRKVARFKSQAAQIGIVSFWIVCWFNRQRLLLVPS